jgi:hypothetical protein
MYADRVEAGANLSIRDRLNGDSVNGVSRRRQIAGKRQRQDEDKWEHDLYGQDARQFSNRNVGASDLRLKLQKKSATQSGNGSLKGGVRDLREKLSGTTYTNPANIAPAKPKMAEPSKLARRNPVNENSAPETKRVASSVSKKKTQHKVETVDSFLQSLGLEKYSITFQAEEVDMTALLHMTDEDLKALGIPMGPRKKITLALESKV